MSEPKFFEHEDLDCQLFKTNGETDMEQHRQREDIVANILGCDCAGFDESHAIPPNALYYPCPCEKAHYIIQHIPKDCVSCKEPLKVDFARCTGNIHEYQEQWDIFIARGLIDELGYNK